MALVHDAKKEIHAKIVFFGPGRSGKTTNLEFIYNKLKPAYRGKFKFMNTPGGKMVFFDFMRPELATIEDYGIHFHIYTVPGEAVDPSVWKNVLKGVDGIVFVADLDPSRTLENRRSLDNLREYLEWYGIRLDEIPFIFQCNKRDVPGAVSLDEMRNLLDIGETTVIPASAESGEGVLPTLSEMVKMVLQRLRDLPLGEQEEAAGAAEEPRPGPEVLEEEITPLEPESGTVSYESEPLVPEPEPTHYFSEPFIPEPETESFDSEPLTLEPVEEDVEYAMEPEPEETAGPETMEPPSMQESANLAAAAEEFVHDFMEKASHDVTADAVFQEPSWGALDEPIEPEAVEPAVVYGEGIASVEQEPADAELELAGGMESLGNGRFRLPVVIRHGGRESKSAIFFDISIETPSKFRQNEE